MTDKPPRPIVTSVLASTVPERVKRAVPDTREGPCEACGAMLVYRQDTLDRAAALGRGAPQLMCSPCMLKKLALAAGVIVHLPDINGPVQAAMDRARKDH